MPLGKPLTLEDTYNEFFVNESEAIDYISTAFEDGFQPYLEGSDRKLYIDALNEAKKRGFNKLSNMMEDEIKTWKESDLEGLDTVEKAIVDSIQNGVSVNTEPLENTELNSEEIGFKSSSDQIISKISQLLKDNRYPGFEVIEENSKIKVKGKLLGIDSVQSLLKRNGFDFSKIDYKTLILNEGKSMNEAWDKRYPDIEDELKTYRGIPIQGIHVDTQESKYDNWHSRIEWHPMDPENPEEEHPDLWDDWSYDLESVKAVIDEYLDKKGLNESERDFKLLYLDPNNKLYKYKSKIDRPFYLTPSKPEDRDDYPYIIIAGSYLPIISDIINDLGYSDIFDQRGFRLHFKLEDKDKADKFIKDLYTEYGLDWKDNIKYGKSLKESKMKKYINFYKSKLNEFLKEDYPDSVTDTLVDQYSLSYYPAKHNRIKSEIVNLTGNVDIAEEVVDRLKLNYKKLNESAKGDSLDSQIEKMARMLKANGYYPEINWKEKIITVPYKGIRAKHRKDNLEFIKQAKNRANVYAPIEFTEKGNVCILTFGDYGNNLTEDLDTAIWVHSIKDNKWYPWGITNRKDFKLNLFKDALLKDHGDEYDDAAVRPNDGRRELDEGKGLNENIRQKDGYTIYNDITYKWKDDTNSDMEYHSFVSGLKDSLRDITSENLEYFGLSFYAQPDGLELEVDYQDPEIRLGKNDYPFEDVFTGDVLEYIEEDDRKFFNSVNKAMKEELADIERNILPKIAREWGFRKVRSRY